jgi:patatin-like phospholipase
MPYFVAVKEAEQKEIDKARGVRVKDFSIPPETIPPKPGTDRVGLAFSGGGIRSATFNLGILQGLARYNLLQRVDYISTVSGGGFIGSWLISWIKRSGLDSVIKGLASSPASPPVKGNPPNQVLMKPAEPPSLGEPYREAEPINFLRDYSNYLTPRLGIFGADVWAAIATYIRNLLLNLVILILFLSGVLLLPRVWEAFFLKIAWCASAWVKSAPLVQPNHFPVHWSVSALATLVGLLLMTGITAASWNLASTSVAAPFKSKFIKQGWVVGLVVVPIFLAAPLASIALWLDAANLKNLSWAAWVGLGSLGYGLLRLAGLVFSPYFVPPTMIRPLGKWKDDAWLVVSAFFAGTLGGVLVGWTAKKFYEWAPIDPYHTVPSASCVAKVACWGTPFLMGILLLTGVLHIGLMKLKFSNEKREWWARMTGWVLIFCLSSAALFGLGIYAPLGVSMLSGYLKTALGGGWLLSTLGGLLAGKSGSTSGKGDGNLTMELAARVAPYAFALGLLCALSFGIHGAITPSKPAGNDNDSRVAQSGKVTGDLQLAAREGEGAPGATLTDLKVTYSAKPSEDYKKIKEEFWAGVQRSADKCLRITCLSVPGWGWLLGLAILLGGVAALLSWRVDINEFSMQLLYRNRLVRCYLGASHLGRNPQPFSGFDPKDDINLWEFTATQELPKGSNPYFGPYPILNSTLSVTHGESLAWQERKGESFVFTPKYCGYEFQEQHIMDADNAAADVQLKDGGEIEESGNRKKTEAHAGFRDTKDYAYPDGGVYLGTAVATSGAAANPNMGFHTSPPLAFLMTVFNVRLGWWLGNPRDPDKWKQSTPPLGLAYLLKELFALTDDKSGFVNLSDGYHFENLGLYELVRRKCKYIVVGDAGADPQHSFDDLGNAIRKCRTDLGIEIEMDLSPLRLPTGSQFSEGHCVVGTIHYELVQPDLAPGVLVYFKPSLTTSDPVDVQNYKTLHPDFPHQSTANQWFDESQFESYRQLGRVSTESALEKVGSPDDLAKLSTSVLFGRLLQIL